MLIGNELCLFLRILQIKFSEQKGFSARDISDTTPEHGNTPSMIGATLEVSHLALSKPAAALINSKLVSQVHDRTQLPESYPKKLSFLVTKVPG